MEAKPDAPSLAQVVHDAVSTLTAAGLTPEAARIDATVLARWCLGWDAAGWLARSREVAPSDFVERFTRALNRRARRDPVSHIIGQREFYSRLFRVTPAVLTPRPETELVIDEALAALREVQAGTPVRACDVGTGSGCVAVTLAAECGDDPSLGTLEMLASDTSEAALQVAAGNVARHGVSETVRLANANLLDAATGPLSLIVSNPPYVSTTAAAALAPEVLREPPGALFAGADGLDVIRQLIPAAGKTLARDGWLIMEIGHDQGVAVTELVAAERRLSLIRVSPDLQQLPRVIVARRTKHL